MFWQRLCLKLTRGQNFQAVIMIGPHICWKNCGFSFPCHIWYFATFFCFTDPLCMAWHAAGWQAGILGSSLAAWLISKHGAHCLVFVLHSANISDPSLRICKFKHFKDMVWYFKSYTHWPMNALVPLKWRSEASKISEIKVKASLIVCLMTRIIFTLNRRHLAVATDRWRHEDQEYPSPHPFTTDVIKILSQTQNTEMVLERFN